MISIILLYSLTDRAVKLRRVSKITTLLIGLLRYGPWLTIYNIMGIIYGYDHDGDGMKKKQ